jgi:predicted Rossmann-fold nucleotide-binding protein
MARIYIEGNHKCQPDSKEYQIAEQLGTKLARVGFSVVSSARKGISEAVFKGAILGSDDSVRIAIDCAEINLPRNSKYTKEIIADNYFDMKMRNCINSDAFIFLPGSFAVLSNLAIILQLKELELMGNKPVICVGEQLEEVLSVFGFYNEQVVDAFDRVIHVDNIDEAVNKLIEIFRK